MRFYLGSHVTSFFERTSVPLFVSRSSLVDSVNPPRASGPWALDSGGFMQIFQYGHWTVTPQEFVSQVRFWRGRIGNLDWASQMDWMAEPHILLRAMVYEGLLPGIRENGPETMKVIQNRYGKLGEKFKDKSQLMERVCIHQQRTIDNLIQLREIAPDIHWMPVLQGWTAEDYIAHAEAWLRAGIDLTEEPIVGLGSVCRRDKLDVAEAVISTLTGGDWRLRLHGFGLKNDAFEDQIIARGLASADSLAWSYMARYGSDMIDDPEREGKKLKGKLCRGTHRSGDDYSKSGCVNCLNWALEWRRKALKKWEDTVLESPRRSANPPRSQIDQDLTEVVLMNVRPGRNVVSPVGGRAGYFIISADDNRICATRHSTGKDVCVATKRAVGVAKRLLMGEVIPLREIDFTVAKETLVYFALTGIIERHGREYLRSTDWAPEDLMDRFGVDLWTRIERWAKGAKKNPRPIEWEDAGDEGSIAAPKSRAPLPDRLWCLVKSSDLDSIKQNGLNAEQGLIGLSCSPEDASSFAVWSSVEVALLSVPLGKLSKRELGPDDADLQRVLDDEQEIVDDHDGRSISTQYDWQESLEIACACTYAGVIPWELLTVEKKWTPA